MVKGKKPSKRVSLKDKYKIQRRVKEHNRKQKRDERKGNIHKKKLSKDPGIPNLFPFKEQLLQQISQEKRDALERKQRERDSRRQKAVNAAQLSQMSFDAGKRNADFDTASSMIDGSSGSGMLSMKGEAMNHAQRRAYLREFNKVVEQADVILEVLDARDPLGCRAPDVERLILSNDPNKRIILLLNKIDLVPREIVERWLTVLRREFPVVAFKASTQKNAVHHAPSTLLGTSGADCLGADALMSLLKNYARTKSDAKTAITVGIVGFPNVGKSSVINSLKRAKVTAVGNTPGMTKTAQLVRLDGNIQLLDSPGIIFASGALDADVILRNAVKVEQIEDPVPAIEAILKRCRAEKLMEIYSVPAFASAHDFLALVARKRGFLKKGGVPDYVRAGRAVLQDWNASRIPFFTIPPDAAGAMQGSHMRAESSIGGDAAIVSKYTSEFDVAALLGTIDAAVLQLKSVSDVGAQYVAMQPGVTGDVVVAEDAMVDDENDDDDEEDADFEDGEDDGEDDDESMEAEDEDDL